MADTEEVLLTDVSNSEALRVRPPNPQQRVAWGSPSTLLGRRTGRNSRAVVLHRLARRAPAVGRSQKDPMPLSMRAAWTHTGL